MFENPKSPDAAKIEGVPEDKILFSLTVEKECDIEGNEIDADISWMRFKKPDGEAFADLEDVEGKLYQPKGKSNGELVLFTPGFPGGNAGRFEQRYAKALLDEGYSFFTIRHNGTSLTKMDTAEEIINCPERLQRAQETGEHHIGGTREGGHKPVEIMREAVTPLMALHTQFDKVHLMGQSMGVAASLQAATRVKGREGIDEKIGNIVGIAGYVGKDKKEDGAWDGMKMRVDDIVEYEQGYIKKVDANTTYTEEDIAEAAALNAKMDIPDHTGLILIYSPNDPLIAEPNKDQEDYLLNYGPDTVRKLVIRDESNLNAQKQHSMLWIDPKSLIRALRAKVSALGGHYVKVPRSKENSGLVEKA